MATESITHRTEIDDFWGVTYSCRKCGAEIQCHHSARYAGGREFYELASGRVH